MAAWEEAPASLPRMVRMREAEDFDGVAGLGCEPGVEGGEAGEQELPVVLGEEVPGSEEGIDDLGVEGGEGGAPGGVDGVGVGEGDGGAGGDAGEGEGGDFGLGPPPSRKIFRGEGGVIGQVAGDDAGGAGIEGGDAAAGEEVFDFGGDGLDGGGGGVGIGAEG